MSFRLASVILSPVIIIVIAAPLMTTTNSTLQQNRIASILTDVQFWVPIAVLLAGLLLLEWIR